jgi:hypothetical protein
MTIADPVAFQTADRKLLRCRERLRRCRQFLSGIEEGRERSCHLGGPTAEVRCERALRVRGPSTYSATRGRGSTGLAPDGQRRRGCRKLAQVVNDDLLVVPI